MMKAKTGLLKNAYDDASIEKDDIKLINRLLKSGPVSNTNVSYTTKLENEFKKYLGLNFASVFSKGRHALSAILGALDLQKDDEVILQAFTCVVVPNSVKYCGLKPVFCDIELGTFGPDLNSIKRLVTKKTKVIIVQHSYGLVCRDYEAILEFAREKNINVIDDCAQSTGVVYKGKKLGYFATAAFYSMQHSKVISCGDGGVAMTNEKIIAKKIKNIQEKSKDVDNLWVIKTLYCIKRVYKLNQNKFLGRLYYEYYTRTGKGCPDNINSNETNGIFINDYIKKMPNILAILALHQLDKIHNIHSRRLKNANIYNEWAIKNHITRPHVVENSVPVYLCYPLILEKAERSKIFQTFGSEINVGYPKDLLIGGSEQIQPDQNLFPNAKKALHNMIYLPCL